MDDPNFLTDDQKWEYLKRELSLAAPSVSDHVSYKYVKYKQEYWPKGVSLYKDSAYDKIFKVFFKKGKYRIKWENKIRRKNKPVGIFTRANQKLDECYYDFLVALCKISL